jgi:hypothetical protein
LSQKSGFFVDDVEAGESERNHFAGSMPLGRYYGSTPKFCFSWASTVV